MPKASILSTPARTTSQFFGTTSTPAIHGDHCFHIFLGIFIVHRRDPTRRVRFPALYSFTRDRIPICREVNTDRNVFRVVKLCEVMCPVGRQRLTERARGKEHGTAGEWLPLPREKSKPGTSN